ncbi:MAG: hypothetical protein D6791_11080 [Chloroflexi bacterium]|nr:MAG: hypothetical protein D6791_11080 [Chloroflexota bacterium]
MRVKALLILWLLGILFPMVWFTRVSATYNRAFQFVFAPTWTHVVMHAFLYAVLVILAGRFLAPRLRGRGWPAWLGSLLGLALGVALLQEGIQLWYTGQAAGADEVFDLSVDLGGAVLGLLVFLRGLRGDGHTSQ